MQPTNDAQFLVKVLEAATDPTRKAEILRAATAAPRGPRMGTVREAAEILKTCTRTVERYARQGHFARVHMSPRKVRYDMAAVERFAAAGAQVVTATASESASPASHASPASMAASTTDGARGWTAICDADLDRICNSYPENSGALFAVWYVLLRDARDKRSLEIQLSDAILADRVKVSRRTVIKMRKLLAEAGLLTCHQKKSAATGNEATTYVLTPTVSPATGEQPIAAGRDALPA